MAAAPALQFKLPELPHRVRRSLGLPLLTRPNFDLGSNAVNANGDGVRDMHTAGSPDLTLFCQDCGEAGIESADPGSCSQQCKTSADQDSGPATKRRKTVTFVEPAAPLTRPAPCLPDRGFDILERPFSYRPFWNSVFNTYQVTFSHELPFLHLPTLRERVSYTSKRQRLDIETHILLLGLLALTCPCMPEIPFTIWPTAQYAAMLEEQLRIGVKCKTIERVQSFLMLAVYELGAVEGKNREKGREYLDIAFTRARGMELYKGDEDRRHTMRVTDAIVTDLTRESRRRTMFSCLMVDRLHGDPLHPKIQTEELCIQLPCRETAFDMPDRDEYTGFLEPGGNPIIKLKREHDSILRYFISLTDLWGEVSRYIANGGPHSTGPDARFCELAAKLRAFYFDLPPVFRWSASQCHYYQHETQRTVGVYISLNLLLATSAIALYRELIPFPVPNKPTGPIHTAVTRDGQWLFRTAIHVIDAIFDFCRDKPRLDNVPVSKAALYAAWDAALITLYAKHFPGAFPESFPQPEIVLDPGAVTFEMPLESRCVTSANAPDRAFFHLMNMAALKQARSFDIYFEKTDKYFEMVKATNDANELDGVPSPGAPPAALTVPWAQALDVIMSTMDDGGVVPAPVALPKAVPNPVVPVFEPSVRVLVPGLTIPKDRKLAGTKKTPKEKKPREKTPQRGVVPDIPAVSRTPPMAHQAPAVSQGRALSQLPTAYQSHEAHSIAGPNQLASPRAASHKQAASPTLTDSQQAHVLVDYSTALLDMAAYSNPEASRCPPAPKRPMETDSQDVVPSPPPNPDKTSQRPTSSSGLTTARHHPAASPREPALNYPAVAQYQPVPQSSTAHDSETFRDQAAQRYPTLAPYVDFELSRSQTDPRPSMTHSPESHTDHAVTRAPPHQGHTRSQNPPTPLYSAARNPEITNGQSTSRYPPLAPYQEHASSQSQTSSRPSMEHSTEMSSGQSMSRYQPIAPYHGHSLPRNHGVSQPSFAPQSSVASPRDQTILRSQAGILYSPVSDSPATSPRDRVTFQDRAAPRRSPSSHSPIASPRDQGVFNADPERPAPTRSPTIHRGWTAFQGATAPHSPTATHSPATYQNMATPTHPTGYHSPPASDGSIEFSPKAKKQKLEEEQPLAPRRKRDPQPTRTKPRPLLPQPQPQPQPQQQQPPLPQELEPPDYESQQLQQRQPAEYGEKVQPVAAARRGKTSDFIMSLLNPM